MNVTEIEDAVDVTTTEMTVQEAVTIVKEDAERRAARRQRQREYRAENAEHLRPKMATYMRRWRDAKLRRLQEAKAVLAEAGRNTVDSANHALRGDEKLREQVMVSASLPSPTKGLPPSDQALPKADRWRSGTLAHPGGSFGPGSSFDAGDAGGPGTPGVRRNP